MTIVYRIGLACGLPLLVAGLAGAGDWPQILGPNRDGKAQGETLAENWPAGGPKQLWTYKLGSGYAGPAVVGQRVIVFHRVAAQPRADQERVEALDVASGRSLWKANFAATYRGGYDADKGPRCVPLAAGGSVYVFGAAGDLRCLALESGQERWSRNLYADYSAKEGYFGAGSTPILVGGTLIANVGGRGAGLVGLDPATGKTLWQATSEEPSYSSPIAVTLGGKEQALFLTWLSCVLVDPRSGKASKLTAFGKDGLSVTAAMPVLVKDRLFLTASYQAGAMLASFDAAAARPVWANDDTLSSQYATPVEHNGFLYGTHGREDQGIAELRCVEAASGKVRWRQPGYGCAHVILSGDKLLIVGVGGRLALAKANPDRYEELAAHELVQDVTRALPALAAGRLFVRAGSGGGQLHCLAVGK
jgi:outer membrane protein assembly factor BamB